MNEDPEDKGDTIKNILRKIAKEKAEYPDELLIPRRERFIRWIFGRRFGCLIFWTIIVAIVLLWLLNNL